MSEDTINISDYTNYAEDFKRDSKFDSLEQATRFVLEHKDHYPDVNDFVSAHDTGTIAEFISLVPEYVNGNITHRSAAKTVGIPKKNAFDALTILPKLITDGTEQPQTFRPDDNHNSHGDN